MYLKDIYNTIVIFISTCLCGVNVQNSSMPSSAEFGNLATMEPQSHVGFIELINSHKRQRGLTDNYGVKRPILTVGELHGESSESLEATRRRRSCLANPTLKLLPDELTNKTLRDCIKHRVFSVTNEQWDDFYFLAPKSGTF